MQRRIIQREEWGAREDDGFRDRALPVDEVWLHHSVTIAPDLLPPFDDDYAAVRVLEAIGESRFGGGISYTYPITPAGLIFEGHSAHRSGAHTLGRNDLAVAICWIGRYDTADPTPEMEASTAWLLVELKRTGVIRRARINGGHGQAPGQATDCPGARARARIARINELAAAHELGDINLSEEDDVSFSDRIQVTSPGDRDYSETDEAKKFIGDTYFFSSDLYKVVPGMLAAILAAVKDGLDEETVLAQIDTSVQTATTEVFRTSVVPALREVVRDVLGEDNAEQADAIVDRLGARLRVVA